MSPNRTKHCVYGYIYIYTILYYFLVVLPGMDTEGKRVKVSNMSDHDGLIGNKKTFFLAS